MWEIIANFARNKFEKVYGIICCRQNFDGWSDV